MLGISGIGIVLFEFGVYPWFVDRIGIVELQRWSGIISVALYLALPNVKYLSWNVTSLLVVQIIMLAILECANTAVSARSLLPRHFRIPAHDAVVDSDSFAWA